MSRYIAPCIALTIACLALLTPLALVTPLHAEETMRDTFCKRNPEARVCHSAHDVRAQERAELEDECVTRPNTEKCKNKRTLEKVRDEKLKYCEENPKACAARRAR